MRHWAAQRHDGGFTLIEVMVALAILGSAMFILLDAHYAAIRLFDTSETEVRDALLLHRAAAMAEVEVSTGSLSGDGEFGDRYEGYAYAYSAELAGDENIPLYQVLITLTTPNEGTREMVQFVYLANLP